MTDDRIIIIIAFFVLLLTHYFALQIGYKMGSKTDQSFIDTKIKTKEHKYVDPFVKEFLE